MFLFAGWALYLYGTNVIHVAVYLELHWYSITYTGHFIMFSMITNIYNKKTPNTYTEPSTMLFSTSIAP
jgi:hypothetical protein